MKRFLWLLVILTGVFSCKNEEKEASSKQESIQEEVTNNEKDSFKKFESEKWHFSVEFPSAYKVSEGELPAATPVINIYDPTNESTPPFAIHENAEASYIAFLPEGFGVDAPSGMRRSFKDWEGGLPLSFEIDPVNSTVYLLENGKPWAASLRFFAPPPRWKDHGSIFIHFAVINFKAECFDGKSNKVKAMETCDPLGGDVVKYFGNVDPESKEALHKVLENISFTSGGEPKREISNLIKVENPMPNAEVQSPLTIRGKARGFWYFEAEAPFKLVDKDYKTLAVGSVTAEGDWMTEDFVPFEAEISFEAPSDERGYLVFSRSNASGKPEHDRVYRIPVLFPPKE